MKADWFDDRFVTNEFSTVAPTPVHGSDATPSIDAVAPAIDGGKVSAPQAQELFKSTDACGGDFFPVRSSERHGGETRADLSPAREIEQHQS